MGLWEEEENAEKEREWNDSFRVRERVEKEAREEEEGKISEGEKKNDHQRPRRLSGYSLHEKGEKEEGSEKEEKEKEGSGDRRIETRKEDDGDHHLHFMMMTMIFD